MKRTFILLSFLILFISCQRIEWNNPFDPNCPKDIWTPTDFKAVQNGTTVTLTWNQPINKISGFKLTKKVDTGSASDLQSQTKSATQLVDVSLTGGKLHTYTIVAYADNNQSNILTATVTPILAAGGITTTAATSITAISATSGGTITSDGGSAITARGVCWATTTNPTIAGSKTTDGNGTGTFTSSIAGLSANTTYFIRAYAINSIGTTYGNEVSFRTLTGISTISTTNVTNVSAFTATSGGSITTDGGSPITARGVCWGTTTNPTITGSKTTDGNGIGTYTSSLKGLTQNVTYYIRAYATNGVGTVYGNEVTFKTPLAPILFNSTKIYGSMSDVEGNTYKTIQIGTQLWMAENLKTTKYNDGTGIPLITDNTAWSNLSTSGYCWYGNDQSSNKEIFGALYNWYTVSSNKLCPTGWHVPTDADWSILTSYLGGDAISSGMLKETGTLHWLSPNIEASNESGFTAIPSGFRSSNGSFDYLGSHLYCWLLSEYSIVDAWSRDMSYYVGGIYKSNYNKKDGFSVRCISGELSTPTIFTTLTSNLTNVSVNTGGNITFDGGGSISERGVCWSTTQNPSTANNKTSDGTGTGSFTSSITGLAAGTTYYIRAYATNSAGTAYGNEVNFKTSSVATGSVTDMDGNVYNTVTIGTQIWMASNLKTTKYTDGATIPLVTDNTAWAALTTPGYCWYNNAATNKSTYGALYNWYTVNIGKLCPTGWHMPSDAEWTTLTTFLGGEGVAGGKLKETGTSHWSSPNTGATNSAGFTALPGGYRGTNGTFIYVGGVGTWWSSTESSTTYAWYRYMGFDLCNVNGGYNDERSGFSIRCISGELTLPTLTTTAISGITSTIAVSGGNITSDGGTSITARGICWSTFTAPTIANSKTTDGTGMSSFTSSLTGLTAGTTYYVRSYATNSGGTAYGNEVNFQTNSVATGPVTDIDGNVYNIVTIGTQVWMKENLKTTRYRNGDPIPNVNYAPWEALNSGAYCWFKYDVTNKATYGALYNWYAISDARSIAPEGWHIPTDEEWTVLVNYLGGESVAGAKLKESGTNHWRSPNLGATNSSGFTALPGGFRLFAGGGDFSPIGGGYGKWGCTTAIDASNAWYRDLQYDTANIFRNSYNKKYGSSVRCIHD